MSELQTQILNNRRFMHCPPFEGAMDESDQKKGLSHPSHAKLITGQQEADKIVTLPPFDGVTSRNSYTELLDVRRSKRAYFDVPMTQAQLAFMLWSAIGIQDFRGPNDAATLRPSPSGGARHPFNLYVSVRNVEGIDSGSYLYLPLKNVGQKQVAIARVGDIADDAEGYTGKMSYMMAGQKWAARAAAVILVTCSAYRAEWRYSTASHRVMLIDLGHLGQNLMLSAASMGLGSCCLAAYDQSACDEALGIDGIEEYTVYALTVGKARD
ncbi:MAG: SagB/ThcOx family dehydrogenase [Coriobacteriia bacterium]|nr:SagB/ThcOx family dehydrogenase [Coriobacteriia bacterium]MCL2870919.1 SagB/ThcOx family dehydrogenase [Coriobacteriia bacterium]